MNGVGKEFVSIQQFIFVDEDCFNWKRKRKKRRMRKLEKTKMYI
jgi:hypothetical protein